jgi:NAD(P)H-dependent FMN reductase
VKRIRSVFGRNQQRFYCAIVFSTPEYAGALPGSFKNLLDWLIGDEDPGSIYEKPVAWINASPRGAEGAHAELRIVLNYAHARIVEDACISVPITSAMVDVGGIVSDSAGRERLTSALDLLSRSVVRGSRCS